MPTQFVPTYLEIDGHEINLKKLKSSDILSFCTQILWKEVLASAQ